HDGPAPVVRPARGPPEPSPLHLVGSGAELDRVIGTDLRGGPGDLLDPPFEAVEVARAGPSRVPAHLEEPTAPGGTVRSRFIPPPIYPIKGREAAGAWTCTI